MKITNKQALTISHLIIDWGTTNFRVFAIDTDGTLVGEQQLAMGFLQIPDKQFAQSLEQVLTKWLDNYKSLPIYMAGMVGSPQGWKSVDYITTVADCDALAKNVLQFKLPWGATATIIPGVSHKTGDDTYDVMRGEEVQLFGLARLVNKTSFNAILPGTHSKHAFFKDDALQSFSSYMTGELFSIISKYSILGNSLPAQVDDESAFLKGVLAGDTSNLTSVLFSARTHRLFKNIAESSVFDYLSGLLIGNELKDLADQDVYLIGGQSLSKRYQSACNALNISSSIVSGDECFLTGMAEIISRLNDASLTNRL
ncbi:MAG: 2-dehydro-3-deoxygalactonokinase [Thalassotalea sp.]